MSAGYGLRLRLFCRSSINDVVIDGQDGNGNFFNGIWFNSIDDVDYSDFGVRAQNDGFSVSGGIGLVPKAGLYIDSFKIASCLLGVRVAGGFGSFYCNNGDIIANGTNFSWDNVLVAEANREVQYCLSR